MVGVMDQSMDGTMNGVIGQAMDGLDNIAYYKK